MQGKVSAIILAAGESRRMGAPKMLLPFGDRTIIECTAAHVAGSAVDETVVVLGCRAEEIAARLRSAPVRLVLNPDYRAGMLQSVIAGLAAICPNSESAMVIPGDQPQIRTAILDAVLEAYRRSAKGIAVPVFQGRRGHPLLFSLRYREELCRFADEGLRRLFRDYPDDVCEVPVEGDEVIRDIDTPDDYRRAQSLRDPENGQAPFNR